MALISLREVSISFGGEPILDDIALQLEPGQRVCLLGRNGAGKTTLMKIIGGELPPDAGVILRQPDLRTARLPQDTPEGLAGTVFDQVASGLGRLGQLISDYHAASLAAATGGETAVARLGNIQHQLEAAGGWSLARQVDTVLSQMELPAEARLETLSGGLLRRVLLAQALVGKPDILMLDEPTNHLDLESINWLEKFLQRFAGTVFFVTHDRAFMRSLANRIIELDRGKLFDWACDYPTFLARKQQQLDDEAVRHQRFDKLLSREEAWIRQGIKARRTRNEGRVKRLQEMRRERRSRRELTGQARLAVAAADPSGQLVVKATNVHFGYVDQPLVAGLTTTILRGDRIGIIGPNGCGKTTLLKLLLGTLTPTSGTIKLGTRLQATYFDQLREQLDPTATVFDSINGGNDKVEVNGNWRSVYSYLQDFLFSPERARSPVAQLSGGERNRLLLARLFTRPANLLVMDEPTNDLDIETLDLLEEKLIDFPGTLLLVSHDREFINNVVTSTLAFEAGAIREYPGGYDDWLARQIPPPLAPRPQPSAPPRPPKAASGPRKLTFKERRELDELPARIDQLEARRHDLYARLADPATYQKAGPEIATLNDSLAETEADLEATYARWAELEELADS